MTNPVRILLVEDERIVAEDVRRSLESMGYILTAVVSSGKDAIQKVQEVRPDLVLMDIVIRGELNGIETAEKIRSLVDVPVVYLTAYADDGTLQKAKLTEPFGYVLKPFENREIRTTIEMALYKHELDTKLRERELWFSTILRSIGEGIIATDPEARVTFMNPPAESLTGWSREIAEGQPLDTVYRVTEPATGRPMRNPMGGLDRDRLDNWPDRAVLQTRNGNVIPVDQSAAFIQDQQGRTDGLVLVFKDVSERQKTEEALRLSEARFRKIAESIRDGLTILEGERTVFINDRACEIFGYPLDELKRLGILDLAVPEERVRLKPIAKRLLTQGGTGEPMELEFWVLRKDGVRCCVQNRYSFVSLREGVVGCFVVTTDITERKKAEEALRRSEKRYHGLYETMEQGVLYFDTHGTVVEDNPAAQRILEIPKADLVGGNLFDPGWDPIREDGSPFPLDRNPVLKSFKTGKPVTNTVLGLRTPAGNRRWILLNATPGSEGKEGRRPDSIFATFTDISQLKQVGMALQNRNIQLAALNRISRAISGSLNLKNVLNQALREVLRLFRSAEGAVFLYDSENDTLDLKADLGMAASAAVASTSTASAPLTSSATVFIQETNRHWSRAKESLIRGEADVWRLPVRLQERPDKGQTKSEKVRFVLVLPIREGLRVIGVLAVVLDDKPVFSESDPDFFSGVGGAIGLAIKNALLYEETQETLERLRLTQEKLVESEKLAGIGALASNVVHEIGNPLAAISNSIQVLQNRISLEGRMKELMDIIGWETERLSRSVDQLREFAKPRVLRCVPSDFREIVKKAIFILNQDFDLVWGRKVTLRFAREMPPVDLDPDALEQVVINCVKNALQAVQEGGVVSVWAGLRTIKNKRMLCLRVKDDGPGMSEVHLRRIFEPYFSTKTRGMGLGMRIAKQIVDSHGGTIQVRSVLGQGTEVTVLISEDRGVHGEHSHRG